jgi:hypothetical protein
MTTATKKKPAAAKRKTPKATPRKKAAPVTDLAAAKATAKRELAELDRKLAILDAAFPATLPAERTHGGREIESGSQDKPSRGEELVPKEPSVKHLAIPAGAGDSIDKAFASAMLSSVYSNALTASRFVSGIAGDKKLGPNETVDYFKCAANRVNDGDMIQVEAMLMSQSLTLNAIFCEMSTLAAQKLKVSIPGAEMLMRMAFKAQAQCRSSLEALAEIKNPRQVSFVKQQNVANQQQVNNGVPAPSSPTRAHGSQNSNLSNGLLEAQDGERMDTGAAGTAGGNDSAVEAVGAIDRPANGRRKGAGK